MFTILHNGNVLYDPRLPAFLAERPKLTREANVFDSLTFTLYPGNPEYGQLDRKTSILDLYQDNSLVAQFIPVYQRKTISSGIEYKCKNILCRMEDFYYRSLTFSGTASAFIDSVLAEYNARVDTAYQVTKGNVHSASVSYETSDPKQCFSALKAITDANGGYLVPRFENGNIYLDYLQDSDLPVCSQKIQFGENMTDLFIEQDTTNCYSVLYPFGTNSDNETVSIASVNSGKDYLENASAIASYGRREKKITWNNVETPADLLSLAQPKLSEIAALYYEAVSLSAVDLHNLDTTIPALAFLSLIDCVSVPHNYSHRYPITKIEIPLDAPQSESITLGTAPLSLTDRITLERRTNASTRSAYGRAISKANKDIDEHYQHVVNVTDKGMSDAFGIIGVSIGADGYPVKDGSGNYVWDDSGMGGEIWGHLNRNAWATQILNNIKDADGNVISLAEVYTDAYGQAIINAINDQRTGTATINANRIKLNATDTITLDAKLSINANTGRLSVNGALDVSSNVYVHGDTYIDGAIEMYDTFYGDSESFQAVTARFGASGSGVSQRILGHGSLLVGLDATENADGTITISFADNSSGGHDSANFRIAATNKYINDVAAAKSISTNTTINVYQSDFGTSVTKWVYVNNGLDSTSKSLPVTVSVASAPSTEVTGNMIDLSGRQGQGTPMEKSGGQINGAIYFRPSSDYAWTWLRNFTISYPTS